MTVLEQLPTLIMYLVAGTLVFIIVAYVLAAKRPATKGPVIGHYTFHMWGADTVEGLTSLDTETLNDENFLLLLWLAKYRNLNYSSQQLAEFKKKVWDKVIVYGVRKGFKKVKIVSTCNVRDPEVAESPPSERRKFVFPYGWLDKMHVYGPCEASIQVGGWKIYFVTPFNLQRWVIDFDVLKSAKSLTNLIGEITVSMPTLQELKIAVEDSEKWMKRCEERDKQLARARHEVEIAKWALAQKPLHGESASPPRPGPTITERIKSAFNWPQIIVAVLAFIGGYSAAPTHFPNIDPLIAGAAFAFVAYGILELLKRKG